MAFNGLFFEQPKTIVPIKAKGASNTRKQIMAGATGCDNCPLHVTWARISSAKMAISGPKDADILVLGDVPDLEEDRAGAAFAGANGKLLRKAIPGRFFDRIAYQHLARCHPGVDDKGEVKAPSPQEAHACGEYLAADVARLPIKGVLGIGTAVLARYFPGASMRDVHGTRMPIEIGGQTVWFYPVFDPAFLRKDAGPKRAPDDGQAWPVFQSDVKRFFNNLDKWPAPVVQKDLLPADIMIVDNEADALEVLDAMEGFLAIDLETNNLRPYNTGARLFCASISDGNLSMAFAVNHDERRNSWALPFLIRVINSRPWLAHNLAFEYAWLKYFAEKHDLEFEPAEMHDSMALARIYHERERILSLEDLTQIHLGVNIKWIMNINTKRIVDYPLIEVLRYCGLDTLSCRRIFDKLVSKVDKDNYRRFVEGSIATAEMALLGLDIDLEASAELKAKWTAKAQDAEERARTLYEVKAYERERGPWSISAPADVGIALVEYGKLTLPRTAGGKQYVTDDAALKAAAPDGHPLIDAVLDYREAAKMVSTYIEPTLDCTERCADGRMHPSYHTMITSTTRLGSEDPNIQNWPSRKHKELRRQIKAPPKHLMVKFDYKALEARVIAMATRDRALCESTILGTDIHTKWRDKALEIYPEYIERLAIMTNQTDHKKILKGGRDVIKTDFVFASFFGSTPDSCAKRTGMPLHHMQQLSLEFWSEFDGVKRWIKDRRIEYKETGSSRLLTGIIRHSILPGNEPINTPIQGSGAAIVVEVMGALSKMARREKDMYLHPRINIHDDLTFILPDDERMEQYIDVIVPELLKVRFDWQIVPLAVEGAVGPSWESMEEFGNFVGDYIR